MSAQRDAVEITMRARGLVHEAGLQRSQCNYVLYQSSELNAPVCSMHLRGTLYAVAFPTEIYSYWSNPMTNRISIKILTTAARP